MNDTGIVTPTPLLRVSIVVATYNGERFILEQLRSHTAAMIATITGTAPISSAAWVTLVRVIPAFCSTTDPP